MDAGRTTKLLVALIAGALLIAPAASAEQVPAGDYRWIETTQGGFSYPAESVTVESCGADCAVLRFDDGRVREYRFDGVNWVNEGDLPADNCFDDNSMPTSGHAGPQHVVRVINAAFTSATVTHDYQGESCEGPLHAVSQVTITRR